MDPVAQIIESHFLFSSDDFIFFFFRRTYSSSSDGSKPAEM